MKIAVIGAGVAGILSLRHLVGREGITEVIAFEQGHELGGQWVYSETVGTDEHGLLVHSNMYANLL